VQCHWCKALRSTPPKERQFQCCASTSTTARLEPKLELGVDLVQVDRQSDNHPSDAIAQKCVGTFPWCASFRESQLGLKPG
jgi:hypothetical protein